jgi:hypothetical protein
MTIWSGEIEERRIRNLTQVSGFPTGKMRPDGLFRTTGEAAQFG